MTDANETAKLISIAVNAMDFIPQMASDRLRSLYVELEELTEKESDRELLINYIAGNFATNSHLCVTILRGKRNDDINAIASEIRSQIKGELDSRKNSGSV